MQNIKSKPFLLKNAILNKTLIFDFEECPPGYLKPDQDVNCSLPCGYPSYGALCGSRCNCSKGDCNHVYGCPVSKYLFFVILNSGEKHYIYIKTSAAFVYGTPIREVYF